MCVHKIYEKQFRARALINFGTYSSKPQISSMLLGSSVGRYFRSGSLRAKLTTMYLRERETDSERERENINIAFGWFVFVSLT